MKASKTLRLVVSSLLALTMLASAAFAGGPLIIWDLPTRTPFAYSPAVVAVYTDLGGMGPLTNAEADALTAAGFAEWSSVPTSYLSAAIAGDFSTVGLPDATGATAGGIVGVFNGGGIHVMYDDDGSITSGFFGAPPGVLGIASPDFADFGTGELLESWAMVNGAAVDPLDAGGASFGGVFTHEFGHSLNLAHTQTNGAVGFFGDDDVPSGCPPAAYSGGLTFDGFETMYPFLDPSAGSVGIQMADINVLDDIASISNVYPTGGWPGAFPSITGTIFLPNGVTEVTGVNVIARNLADPYEDAVSALSGDFTQGDLGPDGLYTFNGLTPGASYVVYVDEIVAGGFSTPPEVPIPSDEEYWNSSESGDENIDDACDVTSITASGVTTADIILNGNPDDLGLGDDDFVELTLPFSFPFCGTSYGSVFVGSNGFLTFGAGDTDFSESVGELLSEEPRIAAMWDDLNPSAGGSITAGDVAGDFVVTYDGVPQFANSDDNSFTITLRADGSYNIDYVNIDATDGLVGRSPGGGAADPGETDLSAAAQPIGAGIETVYESFGSDNDLSGANLEFAPCALAPPPEIAVSPTSLSETLLVDAMSSQTLTVENLGGQELVFSIIDAELATAPKATFGPQGGVLEPNPQAGAVSDPVLTEATRAKLESEKARAKHASRTRIAGAGRASTVELPHVYAVNLLSEDFNGGFPAGWTAIDNEGSGVIWDLASANNEGNYTGGTGDAAGVSSDDFGPAEFDTELRTPTITGFGPNVVLSYVSNYQNFGFLDFLDVDISTDGGSNWTNVLSWNEDHGGFFGPPGENVVLALDPFLGPATEFIVRWRYYDPNSGDWDWYAEIDDVSIVSDDPFTPCPWLTVSPLGGSIPPAGSPVDLTVDFDATGLAVGTYNCEIRISNNSANDPQVIVPVELEVIEDATPPVITLAESVCMWPPNHKMQTFGISDIVASVVDNFDGPIPVGDVDIEFVTSDESENAMGDGNSNTDIEIAGDCKSVDLRRERQGGSNGRVYTVRVSVSDSNGNEATADYVVCVPHDQAGDLAVDDGAAVVVNGPCGSATAGNVGGKERPEGRVAADVVPQDVALMQNHPNPFNPSTTIAFALPRQTEVSLRVFDSAGRLVRTLVSASLFAGTHSVHWDGTTDSGSKVSSGMYVYKLVAGDKTQTKKMLLLK